MNRRQVKIEGGSGGKRAHSNMTYWDYTEEIKRRWRKACRVEAKAVEYHAKHAALNHQPSTINFS